MRFAGFDRKFLFHEDHQTHLPQWNVAILAEKGAVLQMGNVSEIPNPLPRSMPSPSGRGYPAKLGIRRARKSEPAEGRAGMTRQRRESLIVS